MDLISRKYKSQGIVAFPLSRLIKLECLQNSFVVTHALPGRFHPLPVRIAKSEKYWMICRLPQDTRGMLMINELYGQSFCMSGIVSATSQGGNSNDQWTYVTIDRPSRARSCLFCSNIKKSARSRWNEEGFNGYVWRTSSRRIRTNFQTAPQLVSCSSDFQSQ